MTGIPINQSSYDQRNPLWDMGYASAGAIANEKQIVVNQQMAIERDALYRQFQSDYGVQNPNRNSDAEHPPVRKSKNLLLVLCN